MGVRVYVCILPATVPLVVDLTPSLLHASITIPRNSFSVAGPSVVIVLTRYSDINMVGSVLDEKFKGGAILSFVLPCRMASMMVLTK